MLFMITKEQIIEKLKTVDDPELGVNIVDLGLIYEVKVNKNGIVSIKMTLTTPGCPMGAMFDQLVAEAVKSIPKVKDVKIEITFDPSWTPDKMSEKAKKLLGMA